MLRKQKLISSIVALWGVSNADAFTTWSFATKISNGEARRTSSSTFNDCHIFYRSPTTRAFQLGMNKGFGGEEGGSQKKVQVRQKKGRDRSKPKGFAGALRELQMQTFQYSGDVRPGIQSPQRIVDDPKIVVPDYADDGRPKNTGSALLPWIVEVKTPEEIEMMRAAGKVAREVLDIAGSMIQPGVTTAEIDAVVHEETLKVRSREKLQTSFPFSSHARRYIYIFLKFHLISLERRISIPIELPRISEVVLYICE
jgi:hypothetical protein